MYKYPKSQAKNILLILPLFYIILPYTCNMENETALILGFIESFSKGFLCDLPRQAKIDIINNYLKNVRTTNK
jgi:hypothetical protein